MEIGGAHHKQYRSDPKRMFELGLIPTVGPRIDDRFGETWHVNTAMLVANKGVMKTIDQFGRIRGVEHEFGPV
jgi:hypothetical protein